MKYWFATYTTYDGEHEYQENGVLSETGWKLAENKAIKAKAVFVRPGWEEFCEYVSVREIPKRDYQILKKYTTDIDRYFDGKGNVKM